MRAIQKVERWQTTDGRLHESEEAARHHDRFHSITLELRDRLNRVEYHIGGNARLRDVASNSDSMETLIRIMADMIEKRTPA